MYGKCSLFGWDIHLIPDPGPDVMESSNRMLPEPAVRLGAPPKSDSHPKGFIRISRHSFTGGPSPLDEARGLDEARQLISRAVRIDDVPPATATLILDTVA